MQAYVQSTSNLNRQFYIWLLLELISLLGVSFDCIVKVMKSLYSIAEASNHWFAIYHTYHKDKLRMKETTYDPYFLYNSGLFGVMGIQTDNILILADEDFAGKEETVIQTAK